MTRLPAFAPLCGERDRGALAGAVLGRFEELLLTEPYESCRAYVALEEFDLRSSVANKDMSIDDDAHQM